MSLSLFPGYRAIENSLYILLFIWCSDFNTDFSIPFHTLIRIVPRDSSYDEERMPLHPLDVYDMIPEQMKEMERIHRVKKQL